MGIDWTDGIPSTSYGGEVDVTKFTDERLEAEINECVQLLASFQPACTYRRLEACRNAMEYIARDLDELDKRGTQKVQYDETEAEFLLSLSELTDDRLLIECYGEIARLRTPFMRRNALDYLGARLGECERRLGRKAAKRGGWEISPERKDEFGLPDEACAGLDGRRGYPPYRP
jgi:hypothetical protein